MMQPAKEQVSEEQKMELYEIAVQMRAADLPEEFITEAVDTAQNFLGVFELMEMWQDFEDEEEREQVVADIQEMIAECRNDRGLQEGQYVSFGDLDWISDNIRTFKDNLRQEVDERCDSLTELSEKTGMPVSSLSRFFNSASMPRRSTLLKIAKALDISAVKISTDWSYDDT